MKRYQRLSALLFLFFACWFAAIYDYVPLTPTLKSVVVPAPYLLLVTFGAYSLFVVGWGLFNFSESPEASQELEKQRLQARADLTKLGMKL
eukprot:TRINITY_DN2202_c0_g1_i1.p1 TRINITY_DN2202_c0_g1~~TRINITY_DN2202_c0_g1_i1.p1  ORF type:complete len:103 (-),score=31.80 TRINITY_DN2202_c0_g1_i1:220-492(-)